MGLPFSALLFDPDLTRVSRRFWALRSHATRGFASATAFIRYAVEQEFSDRQEGLTGAEERIAATLGQVRKDVFRVARAQQALCATSTLWRKRSCPACRSRRPKRDLKLSQGPRNATTG
ncbi:hypothetical protein SBA4_7660002 [Candidatus Sulfopaludibacter sp. SbA4]|nr:hypothetical protein SBA4_7660002 [Candidatus Sulfopaludibacter sp. SbA4]